MMQLVFKGMNTCTLTTFVKLQVFV